MIPDEEVLTLKDFAPKKSPTLLLENGNTKESTIFAVYNFLVTSFDKAFLGYPVLFTFPNESESRLKVYMSASEAGARIADFLEARPDSWAVLSFIREDTIISVSFLNDKTKSEDSKLLEMPVIGSC